MRLILPLLLSPALAACDSSSMHFQGAAAFMVPVSGAEYRVRHKVANARAMRVDRRYSEPLGPLGLRATSGTRSVAGCRIARLAGDAAVTVGRLDCGNPSPVLRLMPTPSPLTCAILAAMPAGQGLSPELDLLCRRI